jgi:hypothetical protein
MNSTRQARTALTVALCVLALFSASPRAQSLVGTKGAEPPPSELNPAIAATLAPGSVAVKVGDLAIDLWWVKAIALAKPPSGASPSWAGVGDGTLVGAIRVGASWTDIRGYVVKPGVYTLRYALQPANGDHLGVSPNREFVLMSPAAVDTSPDPVGYKDVVALSKQTVRRAHPSALSLDPPVAMDPPLTPVKTDLGLEGMVFSVPTSNGGALSFGLILKGVIQN